MCQDEKCDILSNFQTMCVRVIQTLNFRAKTWYVWLSIFGKTSFPAMLKNQSFWPIASAFFCKLTKLLNANPSSPWVLQNLASSCLFPRDEKTLSLSLRPRTSRASFSRVLL